MYFFLFVHSFTLQAIWEILTRECEGTRKTQTQREASLNSHWDVRQFLSTTLGGELSQLAKSHTHTHTKGWERQKIWENITKAMENFLQPKRDQEQNKTETPETWLASHHQNLNFQECLMKCRFLDRAPAKMETWFRNLCHPRSLGNSDTHEISRNTSLQIIFMKLRYPHPLPFKARKVIFQYEAACRIRKYFWKTSDPKYIPLHCAHD